MNTTGMKDYILVSCAQFLVFYFLLISFNYHISLKKNCENFSEDHLSINSKMYEFIIT